MITTIALRLTLSPVLLTDLCVRTSRIATRVRIALDRGRAGDSGGAVVVDLTVGHQSGATPLLLRGGGEAVRAVGALGEGAVAPAAHDLDADVAGREAGDRAGTDDGFDGLGGVVARGGNGRC